MINLNYYINLEKVKEISKTENSLKKNEQPKDKKKKDEDGFKEVFDQEVDKIKNQSNNEKSK